MPNVERHIDRHTAILAAALGIFVFASVFFLFHSVPMIWGAHFADPKVDASCGCSIAAATLPPLVTGLLVALSILAAGFLILFTVTFIKSLVGTFRVRRVFNRIAIEPSPNLLTLADAVGLRGRFTLVDVMPEGLMTVGFVRPHVYLAQWFARSLAGDELEAALRHEAAHLRRYDPLRQFLTVLIESSLGFLAPVRRTLKTFRTEIEMSADAAASRSYADTDALSRAFLKALSKENRMVRPIAATALSVTEDRLEQLLNPGRPIIRRVPSFLVLLLCLVISGALFAANRVAAKSETVPISSQAGEVLCRPTPRCVKPAMTPAPVSSPNHGMCSGGVCLTSD